MSKLYVDSISENLFSIFFESAFRKLGYINILNKKARGFPEPFVFLEVERIERWQVQALFS